MFVSYSRFGYLLFFAVYYFGIFYHCGVRGESENYCDISSCKKGQHTMCLFPSSTPSSRCSRYNKSGSLTSSDIIVIVNKHNEWREKVAKGLEKLGNPGPQPAASNMKILSWDTELALIAQRWVDQCLSGHDGCRNVEGNVVGQNIATFWTTDPKPDLNPVNMMQGWYDEVKLFSRDNVAKFSYRAIWGHYSQLVSANTSRVGCGRAVYWDTEMRMNTVRLVCNYKPAGNYVGLEVYKIGRAGSACTSGVSKASSSLCN